MACDAISRQYDVDHDTVIFKKLEQTKRYDQGTITFRARNGKLIDLDKMHESIWATRLSGGTRSGLVHLIVTTVGTVESGTTTSGDSQPILQVEGSDRVFQLGQHSDEKHAAVFRDLQKTVASGKQVRVTGQIDNYVGRWPDVLRKRSVNPRRILVTSFDVVE